MPPCHVITREGEAVGGRRGWRGGAAPAGWGEMRRSAGTKPERDPAAAIPGQPVDDEATFSDDEETHSAEKGVASFADESPLDWPSDGFDFSGVVLADASAVTCALCGNALELSWDPKREALVCVGAAMLRHEIFHAECLARRRGPAEPSSGK